jgi:hypothetical protein
MILIVFDNKIDLINCKELIPCLLSVRIGGSDILKD